MEETRTFPANQSTLQCGSGQPFKLFLGGGETENTKINTEQKLQTRKGNYKEGKKAQKKDSKMEGKKLTLISPDDFVLYLLHEVWET